MTTTADTAWRLLAGRLGHASPQAALRYQHATKARDVAIADAMDVLITIGTSVGTPTVDS